MMTFLLWLLLLIFCWPLALLALVLYPIVWLVLLPFRLLGVAVDGVFELLKAIKKQVTEGGGNSVSYTVRYATAYALLAGSLNTLGEKG